MGDDIAYATIGSALARIGADAEPRDGWRERVLAASGVAPATDEEMELLIVLQSVKRASVIAPMYVVLYDDKEHIPGAERTVAAWAVTCGLAVESLPIRGSRGPYYHVLRVTFGRSKVEVYCGERAK